jgi:cyclopropane fatty-acyl-phospholipid synthase-like methyltransferase
MVDAWIPALERVHERLEAGGRVADVGCGHGVSAIVIAQDYPAAEVIGFDYHDESIAEARPRAEAAGLSRRVRFEVAAADAFPGVGYDLVASFDCLHDMGDPVAVARRVRETLAEDGTWMIVDPYGATASRTTSTPWRGPTTRSPRCCASRTRCRRTAAWRSGRRPVRRVCARS